MLRGKLQGILRKSRVLLTFQSSYERDIACEIKESDQTVVLCT